MRDSISVFSLLLLALVCPRTGEAASQGSAPQSSNSTKLSLAWPDPPFSIEDGLTLHHPDVSLHDVEVEITGDGVGQALRMDRPARRHSRIRPVPLHQLDADRFELRDASGLWAGIRTSAPVSPGVRSNPGTLHFAWEQRAILEWHVQTQPITTYTRYPEEYSSIAPTARVSVTTKDTGVEFRAAQDGRYQHLRPGTYRAEFFAQIHRSQTLTLSVTGGQVLHQRVTLAREPDLRNVHFRILPNQGPYPWESRDPNTFWRTSVGLYGDPSHSWRAEYLNFGTCGVGREHIQPIRWEREGQRWVGTVTFRDVPPRATRVEASATDCAIYVQVQERADGDWEVTVHLFRDLEAPGWGLHLRLPEPSKTNHFLGLDSELYVGDSHATLRRVLTSDRTQFVVPDSVLPCPKVWALTQSGYQTVYGRYADFHGQGFGQRIASTTLVPGIKTHIQALTPAGNPLADLPIFADGERIATTGPDGVVCLERTDIPALLHAEWHGQTWTYRVPSYGGVQPWLAIQWKADSERPQGPVGGGETQSPRSLPPPNRDPKTRGEFLAPKSRYGGH